MLTLVGAGGMGKTRLALEAARTQLEMFRDGVFFVSLAPLTSASAIVPAIANAIGLTLRSGDPRQALLRYLRDKHVLLILDNFEHLLASSPTPSPSGRGGEEGEVGASLVVDILEAAPQVQIIATSRERLNVRGEHLYMVEGMDYAPRARLAEAATAPAVRLFVQSARRVRPDFKLSETTLSDVLRICELAQGMPLGLELAAAWAETLLLDQIAAEIECSADFLASEWRDAPERQRSMRAVFDWSWNLLNEGERQIFRRLSVFRGGFTREAAQAVVSASVRVLTRLMHKSLLRWAEARGTTGRYEAHELLRQFAAEQLDANPDDRAAVEARHSAYYLDELAAQGRRLACEPHAVTARLLPELDNIRQAWAWAVQHAPAATLARRAPALQQYYRHLGLLQEGEIVLRAAIAGVRRRASAGAAADDQTALSRLLAGQALFGYHLGQYDAVIGLGQEAIRLAQASGDRLGEALGLFRWSQGLYRKADFAGARTRGLQASALARAAPDVPEDQEVWDDLAWELPTWISVYEYTLGNYQQSKASCTVALERCRALQRRFGETTCLRLLLELTIVMGAYEEAAALYVEALEHAQADGDHWNEGLVYIHGYDLALAEGAADLAETRAATALKLFQAMGYRFLEAASLMFLQRLAAAMGDTERAYRLLDEARQVERSLDAPELHAEILAGMAVLHQHAGAYDLALACAEQSAARLVGAPGVHLLVPAWLAVGRAQEALGRLDAAAAAYSRAQRLAAEGGLPHLTAEPRAGLARLALQRGDRAMALAEVEVVLARLARLPLAALDEPLRVHLTCYQVLAANGDPRTAAVLQQGYDLLQAYADHIADEGLRHSFLENVAAHRELRQAYTQALAHPIPQVGRLEELVGDDTYSGLAKLDLTV